MGERCFIYEVLNKCLKRGFGRYNNYTISKTRSYLFLKLGRKVVYAYNLRNDKVITYQGRKISYEARKIFLRAARV